MSLSWIRFTALPTYAVWFTERSYYEGLLIEATSAEEALQKYSDYWDADRIEVVDSEREGTFVQELREK
jgi:hypothetical protein